MFNDLAARLRAPGWTFLYWIVFLLALEPGNVMHAQRMGHPLEFDIEALRICVAALLACSSALPLVALARRFPLSGSQRGRSVAIHAAAAMVISFVLIVVSCFLAAWILLAKLVPSMAEVLGQLAANWLLLSFALVAFSVLGHLFGLFSGRNAQAIPIRTRRRLGYLDLTKVEWIESQGNYLALHAGGKSHLIRETMSSFVARMDPARFIRIHRRMVVDVHRICELQPIANGDFTLKLQDGRMLRGSRGYRDELKRRWAEVMARR
jgi:DNA-binding LytR/AlgR family response regulator